MNNLKLIGLTFVMLFSSCAFAQEKSEIVMTKSELESFLETVAKTRRAQLEAKNEAKSKIELAELRSQYNIERSKQRNNQVEARDLREVSNYEILREIDRLNARLDIYSQRDMRDMGRQGSNSTLIVPGQNVAPTTAPISSQDLATAKTIWDLQRQLDSLKTVQNIAPKTPTSNQEIDDLRSQFLSLEQRLANADNPAERRSILEELLAKFKNFKKQVFFANDSDNLSSADLSYIQDVTSVLKQYPELSIVLEGWASTRGNANYNKQLSMRRSESVEQALISNGISANRIVSSFRGEDKSSSEAMARRVDMSIILK